ncbi:MAG TPA: hypothetical protein VJZ76_10845 [Thermoanaerobaculia bacterium]|nr:hypothetical protein [Thermoanaerobaculia bacterium]
MPENRPRLPRRDALIRFFAERPALPVREAAALLGWPSERLASEAQEEDALLPGDLVEWSEVAFQLLRVWPRAALLRQLGKASALLPRGLHLTPVRWNLPMYLVRAMEVQAVLKRANRDDVHGIAAEEHVAEALDLLIDDETLAFFRKDAEFLAAYEYPETGNQE